RRFEKGNIIVDLGRAEGIVYHKDQIPRENYNIGDRIRAYVQDVVKSSTSPQIILSRTSGDFVRKLFDLEVPEISEGIVQIMAVAREPGMRAKIAVASRDPNVDPVGACVGMKGSRVQSVVNELRGEKIDIVTYSENPAKFVCNALAPAEVTKVIIDEDARSMQIIVADDQLSLAIGKKGQNVRLAVQLSGWRLDIQSETKWQEIAELAKSMFARIPQIPSIAVDLLIKSGYTDLEELADAKIEDLTRFPGINEERANGIIDICNEILDTGNWPLPEQAPATSATPVAESAPREPRAGEAASRAEAVPPAPSAEIAEDTPVPPELLIDLIKLPGVGLKSAEALYRAGYRNRTQLAGIAMEALLAVPGLDMEVAQRIADVMRK
ncbi:MAG: transcription termination factor NusA, partial [Deltaproteobacteria bacterium]|nr:transcription termination factor NusA [Deltaproteobacteria bacterium]